jgi:hypothetical protein
MTDRERRDPYIVLGVPRQASGEEIAHAYRRAASAQPSRRRRRRIGGEVPRSQRCL